MKRQELLYPYIDACRDKPFAWVSWDCCQFAPEWVSMLTGIDHRSKFPAYANEEEARALLAERGGLLALVDSVLPRIHPSRACEGDLVLSNDVTGAALGICLGVNSAHVGPDGLIFLPTHTSIAAWRVE